MNVDVEHSEEHHKNDDFLYSVMELNLVRRFSISKISWNVQSPLLFSFLYVFLRFSLFSIPYDKYFSPFFLSNRTAARLVVLQYEAERL